MMTRYDETGFEPLPNVSIDDFAAPAEPHEFSAAYQARKAALLGEYRVQCAEDARREAVAHAPASHVHANAQPKPKRLFRWKFAVVAAAAALIVLPVGAFAVANNADFFANAFGTGARESIASHDESIAQGETTYTVTYPAREYVDIDPEEAERLLGDHLMTTPIEVMAGDHKITVLSAVRDDNSAVIHYTVSREGGVTALEWSDLTNQGKGAYIPIEAPYYWQFVSLGQLDQLTGLPSFLGGTILVNKERTTADTIDCYEYAAFECPFESGDIVTLQVESRGDECDVATYDLPAMTALPSIDFASAEGDAASVSAISLRVGGVFGDKLGSDPCIDRIEVTFADGTSYIVFDRAADLDNTSYILGRELDESAHDLVVVFNRLVNPESITAITVSGVDAGGAEFTR